MLCAPALSLSSKINQSSPTGVNLPSIDDDQFICRYSLPALGSVGEHHQFPSVGKVLHAESQSPEPLAENGINSEESKEICPVGVEIELTGLEFSTLRISEALLLELMCSGLRSVTLISMV